MRLVSVSAIAIVTSLVSVGAGASEAPRHSIAAGVSSLALAVPEWHRPLPLGAEDVRLVGEAASREFPVYLTAGEATRPARIRLAYMNAISVMPETFKLTLKINDSVVGETVVQKSDNPEILNLDVPAGILEAGFNSVRVSVRQTHRVDCSPEATYELWTQLIPEQSGLVFTGASGEIRDLRDLPAVKPGNDGAVRIRVRTPEGLTPDSMNRASRAVQAAVVLGHYANPKIELASELQAEGGLDVIVGPAPAIARSMGFRVPGAGPRSQISHDMQSGRVALIVSGDTEGEVDAALDALSTQASAVLPQGSAAGLRALRNVNGRQVEGGETLTLADLGLESEPFRGRLQRQTVRIQMPPDLLAADYGRVTFAADAVYASGLSPASKLIVRVNGAPISEAAMPNPAGAILNKRVFQLPISTFKPGLNTIDFEADTRTSGDEKCDLAALTDQHERFLLSGTSELTIPALGRVGALPSISSVLPGGLARLSSSGEIDVFVPKARLEAVETALTTLAKMASVSRQVSKTAFSFDRSPDHASHVLAFGAYDDLPEATLRAAGLDPAALRQAWQNPAPTAPKISRAEQPVQVAAIGDAVHFAPDALKANMEVEKTGSLLTASFVKPPVQERASDMLRAFSDDGSSWLRDHARLVLQTMSSTVSDSLNRVGFLKSHERERLPLTEAGALVVAQGARMKDLETGWRALPGVESTTVIVAPTTEALSHSMSTLLSGSLWQQFVGDAAVYTPKDNSISTRVSQATLLVPTASLDIQNIRLIAAGWLSRNIPIYLAVLLGIFVVMTAFMHRALRSSGVREP